MQTKYCYTCESTLSIDAFFVNKDSRDGRYSKCKSCCKKYQDNYIKKPGMKEKITRKQKEYWAKEENKDRMRYYGLNRRFGITKEQYVNLLKEQNSRCAICNKLENDPRHKHLSVDHNHENGKIRGLLCNNCNKALGLLKDNKINLENAIKYLEKYV